MKRIQLLSPSLFVSLVSAFADNLNPKGTGCVDPSGYLQCYQDNIDAATKCVEDAKATCGASVNTCLVACGNVQLAANLGCWLTSCWNQVYSCAYQGTAIQYLDGADRVQGSINIPFYPAPEGAPGGCVCNLGYVYGNYTVTLVQDYPCGDASVTFAGTETQANCQCCWDSSILSNIISTCPQNDLSSLSISTMLSSLTAGNNLSASDNCQILDSSSNAAISACHSSFSIDTSATTLYNPGALPSGFPGTLALSDEDGSVTSVPFEAPYTLELFPAFTSTITPVAAGETQAAKGTATGKGTSTGVETTGTKGTGAAAATQTGKSAAVRRVRGGRWGYGVVVVVAGVAGGLV